MSGGGIEGPSILAMLVKSLVFFGVAAVGDAGRRAGFLVGNYLVVAGLFGISLCFLTFSGYRAISLAVGSIYASLIVGCVYLVVGLVTMLVLQARRR